LRNVDSERATFEVLLVELVECLLGTFRRGHLDEAEAARLARHSVEHEGDFLDLTAGTKLLFDQFFGRVKRQVANVETISHSTHLRGSKKTDLHPPLRGEGLNRPHRDRRPH
jgi:hypothetical protein